MEESEDAECRARAAAATVVGTASPTSTLSVMATAALAGIHHVFNKCDIMQLDPSQKIAREILLARGRRIVLHGVGREGLMMRAFTMRLFHLGLQASCLGDMTCPRLGPGDLFIASAGPGAFSSVNALMITAKRAGAKVLLVTAQPDGDAAGIADEVAWLPAQTMKEEDPDASQPPVNRLSSRHSLPEGPMEEQGKAEKEEKDLKSLASPSKVIEGDPEDIYLPADNKILPMGSVYEGALYILFEIVTSILRVKLGETLEGMRARHTNME